MLMLCFVAYLMASTLPSQHRAKPPRCPALPSTPPTGHPGAPAVVRPIDHPGLCLYRRASSRIYLQRYDWSNGPDADCPATDASEICTLLAVAARAAVHVAYRDGFVSHRLRAGLQMSWPSISLNAVQNPAYLLGLLVSAIAVVVMLLPGFESLHQGDQTIPDTKTSNVPNATCPRQTILSAKA